MPERKYYEDCVALLKQDKLSGELQALNELYRLETDTEKRKEIAGMISALTTKMRR